MSEGDLWRGGEEIEAAATPVADMLARIIDTKETDVAVKHLLAAITVNLIMQAASTRRVLVNIAVLHAGLFGLVLWRVW